MTIVKLRSWYNKAGEFTLGKEYIAHENNTAVVLYVDNNSFILDNGQENSFKNTVKKLHLENLSETYSRPGPGFMKWELEYESGEKMIKSSGVNSVPPQVSRLIEIFQIYTNDYPAQPDIIHEAVIFATRAHKGQVRKGTDVPYITHPMEVYGILCDMGAGTDLKISGLLHDVVEDTDITVDRIEEKFGKEVARLVTSHTEDKSKSWFDRKQSAIDRVNTGDKQVAMLIMADKISNLKSMLSDYLVVGDKLWSRFSSTKEMQSVHNDRLIQALHYLSADKNIASAYRTMVELNEELYVDFYLDTENECIWYDKCVVGKGCYDKKDRQWKAVDYIPLQAVKISRTKAQKFISLWDSIDNI